MTFLYPLGLLGLIGVPIIIIIYIIKNKYIEQTVSSTYLWTLSEKFLKRKKPLPKIAGLISLILQLLAVISISLAIANPVFIFPGQAKEYCFIVDTSGSMNMMVDSNTTRLEKGKEKIEEMLLNAKNGSVYTLITVGDVTQVACEQTEDKDVVLEKLQEIQGTYSEIDVTNALETAQKYFTANNGLSTYFITDKTYEVHDNVEIINLDNQEVNYVLSDVSYILAEDTLTVTGKVISYNADTKLNVALYINGTEEAVQTQELITPKNEKFDFTFSEDVTGFEFIKVEIVEEDAFIVDNSIVMYNAENENSYTTLIVSDSPLFIQYAILSAGNTKVKTMTEKEYEESGENKGYGLYVFDKIAPKVLPTDGAVWFFNQQSSIEGAGFSFRSEVILDEAGELEISKSSSSVVKTLTQDVKGNDLYVKKYVKYGVGNNFTTLFSYEGQPIIFTGETNYGNRQVVFAFSLNESNFPLLTDYALLVRNLLNYSFPSVIEKVNYVCGEKLEIVLPPTCTTVKIESPKGETEYPENNVTANEYVFKDVGLYTITLTVGEQDREYYVYVGITEEESKLNQTDVHFALTGEKSDDGLDGKYDDLIVIFILLAVVFMIDWGVYCYDKYQLR